MKSIKVNGSLTIELKNKFYVVESDVYYYDDIVNYPENTIILFRDTLFKTKKPVKGVTPVDGDYYTLVKATDEVSDYARLDQVITHEDLSNFVEKKTLIYILQKKMFKKIMLQRLMIISKFTLEKMMVMIKQAMVAPKNRLKHFNALWTFFIISMQIISQ